MDADHFVDEVAFEVPTYVGATGLRARLEPTWRGRIEDLGHAWSVVTRLRPDHDDLCVLLRDVQSWLDVSALGAVRFRLDGRDYVLQAIDPAAQVVVP